MRRAVVLFAIFGLAACTAAAPPANTAQTGGTQTGGTGTGGIEIGPPPAANPAGRTYIIFFQEWSAGLDASALKTIASAVSAARAEPGAAVIVTGYADPLGSVQANIYLTETRAQVVTDQLAADGLDPARVRRYAVGKVPYQLTSQESRRVVITIGGS